MDQPAVGGWGQNSQGESYQQTRAKLRQRRLGVGTVGGGANVNAYPMRCGGWCGELYLQFGLRSHTPQNTSKTENTAGYARELVSFSCVRIDVSMQKKS